MKRILHLISSPRGKESYSVQLGQAIIDKIKQSYPDATVDELNLSEEHFDHLSDSHIQSFFTPHDQLTDEHRKTSQNSDEAIERVMEADFIVIGAPLYNFGVPSSLKAWIDHVSRRGKTFRYDENGPEGLIKGKKVYIAMSSGGVYSEGPMQSYDFLSPYLKTVLGFLGMTDVKVFRVEGVSIPGIQEHAMSKAVNSIVI
jgi:FMN-dependent NADH-azoreductase